MNSRQYRKRIKRMVIPHLDQIVKQSKNTAQAYSVERIPMKSLYTIIDQGKVSKIGEAALDQFIEKYNDLLTKMKSICKGSSDQIGDGKISIKEIELIVGEVKKAFLQGLQSV